MAFPSDLESNMPAKNAPKPLKPPHKPYFGEPLGVWQRGSSATSQVLYYQDGKRVTVHNYIGHDPNEWFVTCHDLGIEKVDLKSETIEEAKVEALQLVLKRAQRAVEALQAAITNNA
jgi:hypothetical protein